MFDVITFGSATQDIFIKSKSFLPVASKVFKSGKGICLTTGSKTEVEEMLFTSGGGGTNTAATFARQGFKVAYCGMIGQDADGQTIIEELKDFGIDTSLVARTSKKPTNHSVFLGYPGQDKLILVYRGASDLLEKKDIPWAKLKTRWFYLAPFSGQLAYLTEVLIDFARQHNIKVAFNPGYNQLKLPQKTLERILKKVDVLILNQEEASLLTKIPYQEHGRIFQKIDGLVKGIVIMTQGDKGAVVSDGQYLYQAPIINLKVVSLTGAGDSFGSGFVSAILKEKGQLKTEKIQAALQFATANSAFCLTKWGAKEGLLNKGQKYPKVKIVKMECDKETKKCLVK